MDEYQKHLVDSIKEAANTSIREKADEVKINKDNIKLIKEKRKLRRQYVKQELPSTKSSISKVSLEKDLTKSWCRIKNVLKLKTQKTYPTLTLDNKPLKPTQTKQSLFLSLWKGTLGSTVTISMTQILANPYIFTSLDSTSDSIHDKDDNHRL